MVDLETLADVRRRLAVAKAKQADARDVYHVTKLYAEVAAINEAQGNTKALGSNEKDRERAFASVVAGDPDCRQALANLREIERDVLVLDAELSIMLDQRRAEEADLMLQHARLSNPTVPSGWHDDDC